MRTPGDETDKESLKSPPKAKKQMELRQGLQHPVSLRMGPLCLNHEHSVKDAGLPRCSASQEGHHPSIYFRP